MGLEMVPKPILNGVIASLRLVSFTNSSTELSATDSGVAHCERSRVLVLSTSARCNRDGPQLSVKLDSPRSHAKVP